MDVSAIRLYGASIGIVSGLYSMGAATLRTGSGMAASEWFMLVLGLVVLVHGILLVTPYADRIGNASGPLMILYSLLMLLNQGVMATMDGPGDRMGGGMDGGMGMETGMETAAGASGMGVDVGMVALAVLMLASGVIMTWGSDGMSGEEMGADENGGM